MGYTNRKIYADFTGSMDTVVYEFELESVDQYFTMERGIFVNPDEATQRLIDQFNNNAVTGYKEI